MRTHAVVSTDEHAMQLDKYNGGGAKCIIPFCMFAVQQLMEFDGKQQIRPALTDLEGRHEVQGRFMELEADSEPLTKLMKKGLGEVVKMRMYGTAVPYREALDREDRRHRYLFVGSPATAVIQRMELRDMLRRGYPALRN